MKIKGGNKSLKGILKIPGDKSISHRSIILLSISEGVASIENLLYSDDVLWTLDIFKKLGVEYKEDKDKLIVYGVGLDGLKGYDGELYSGNSGTTMRLMSGLLVGQKFNSILTGDESLSKRPMYRIIEPLRALGGLIYSEDGNPPLSIKSKESLKEIDYDMKVASAQVKSAILLAGLYSNERVTIRENRVSRNHTENMLRYLGADLEIKDGKIVLEKRPKLLSKDIVVPGDISSAAYFMVAGSILEDSNIVLKEVGINETRSGIIDVLKKMNANIYLKNIKLLNNEKMADIEIKSSELKGIVIEGEEIGRLIDEIPIISVAAAYAEGLTVIKEVEELRVKETDRLSAIITELRKAGVKIWEEDNNLFIEGGCDYKGQRFNSYKDHRMAMALSVFSLKTRGESKIIDSDCIDISYPNFYNNLFELSI